MGKRSCLAQLLCVAMMMGSIASYEQAAAAVEDEGPESPVSSPPMSLDDPGTPGPHGLEVNFVGTLTRLGPGHSSEGLLDANYGIGDRLQLKYERPYVTEHASGTEFQRGIGATEIGVKWRFVDRHELEIAFYPQYQFDDGFTLKDEEGIPEASEGRSVYLPLLISENMARVYTLAANYGYRRNLDGRGNDNNIGLGIGRAMGWQGRVMAEVFSERDESFHNRQTDARVGVFFLPFPKSFEHSSFETPVFASLGHSIGKTESGEKSTTFCFGLSWIRKPRA
ncbi:MAG: hypothetical protein E6K72_04150 [Candidatus Eisenbacteria bacterium]|uniref:Transporter n=1 Tax=Eiseniibacteriota bacterium TaxID=2212470 RepID=A0A538T013_UNCEI|nr:MAG: hypothetical protein E6K72_04150 [Candidatus Eisenbacteria bacterium]